MQQLWREMLLLRRVKCKFISRHDTLREKIKKCLIQLAHRVLREGGLSGISRKIVCRFQFIRPARDWKYVRGTVCRAEKPPGGKSTRAVLEPTNRNYK